MSVDSIPRLERAPDRRIPEAYFPGSPAGTVRESTLSETLSVILGSEPESSVEDLEEALKHHPEFKDESAGETAVAALREAYETSGRRGARGGQAQQYVIPFHPLIPKTIRPEEFRNWGQWYRMLMTTGSPPTFETELHHQLVDTLEGMEASNLFEEFVIDAARGLERSEADELDTTPVPHYVSECSDAFVEDLRAWIGLLPETSSSVWLRALRDLICFHYMASFIQIAINLEEEFMAIQSGDDFEPSLSPIHFALWDETASQDRQFAQEWDRIERALYESWGRIVVLGEVVDVGLSTAAEDAGIEQRPYTISEAIEEFPSELKQRCVKQINSHYPEEERPGQDISLVEAAAKMEQAVRSYNESLGGLSSQAAYTLSYRAVRQLGSGNERQYIRVQRGVGTTSRLSRGALRLFAQLFTATPRSDHIKEFEQYLYDRGIQMDELTYQSMIDQLEDLGLIHKQSDSGEAIYVRTI
jgi:DNA phosphorothioation-dependent restriction protein DptG